VSFLKWVEGVGLVTFLKEFVKKHSAKEYAEDMAIELKKIIDNEVGQKRGEVIRSIVLPWIDELYVTFRKTILKD